MMKFHNSKVSSIMKIYIWLYRLLGLTFGGIVINSSGKLGVNYLIKYYGYLIAIFISISSIYSLVGSLHIHEMIPLFESGKILLYVLIFKRSLRSMLVIGNLFYLNLNGFEFFEVFYRFQLTRNQFILFVIWICHVIIPLGMIAFTFSSTNFIQIISSIHLILHIVNVITEFMIVWAVPFVTWIISMYFFDKLKYIEQTLIEKTNRNSGTFKL